MSCVHFIHRSVTILKRREHIIRSTVRTYPSHWRPILLYVDPHFCSCFIIFWTFIRNEGWDTKYTAIISQVCIGHRSTNYQHLSPSPVFINKFLLTLIYKFSDIYLFVWLHKKFLGCNINTNDLLLWTRFESPIILCFLKSNLEFTLGSLISLSISHNESINVCATQSINFLVC